MAWYLAGILARVQNNLKCVMINCHDRDGGASKPDDVIGTSFDKFCGPVAGRRPPPCRSKRHEAAAAYRRISHRLLQFLPSHSLPSCQAKPQHTKDGLRRGPDLLLAPEPGGRSQRQQQWRRRPAAATAGTRRGHARPRGRGGRSRRREEALPGVPP